MNSAIQQYTIHIADNELQDLYHRLRHTRLPAGRNTISWNEGTDPGYFKTFIDYWRDVYNWREREAWLNTFNHFLTEVDGVHIHFLHAKSGRDGAVPLLLMQGWPGSFIQVLDILPLLTDTAGDAQISFDVVAMSLPGYAFSDSMTAGAMNFECIADLAVKLMTEILGYNRFAARGSDQGALVQQQIGLKYPQFLIGLHRSGITPFIHPLPGDLDGEEVAYQKRVAEWAKAETAYALLHSSRPETLLPALCDSPVGLASWIIEKFQRWGDCGQNVDEHFGREKLLDNICLHWFANSGSGAIRLYRDAAINPGLSGFVEVPTAIAMPLRDGITVPAPLKWARRFYNVQQWTVFNKGGHFPEWEVPLELARDIRAFFKTLIK